jgi:hypothetical protein
MMDAMRLCWVLVSFEGKKFSSAYGSLMMDGFLLLWSRLFSI